MALHKDLTGTDLHEPKGVASAASGTVYVADGSGSGEWATLAGSYIVLTRTFDDISTSGDIYIPVPLDGTIDYILGVLDAGITVADATVSFSIGGVSVDNSSLSVAQSGSAAGSSYSSSPSGHNSVVQGDVIKVSTDGASTGAVKFTVAVRISVS